MPSREYRVVVQGESSDTMAVAFDGMALKREDGSTVLTGPVRGQVELQGFLQRVSDLCLTLL